MHYLLTNDVSASDQNRKRNRFERERYYVLGGISVNGLGNI
ncbi:hypothetical protein [Thermaurantimonas sp.]